MTQSWNMFYCSRRQTETALVVSNVTSLQGKHCPDLITRQNKITCLAALVFLDYLFVHLSPNGFSREELSQHSNSPFPDVSHCFGRCGADPEAKPHNDYESLPNKHHCFASIRVIITVSVHSSCINRTHTASFSSFTLKTSGFIENSR